MPISGVFTMVEKILAMVIKYEIVNKRFQRIAKNRVR